MKRLLGVALFLLAAAVAQAQTAPPPTEPTHPTAYNAFYNILALPTSGPIIEAPAGSSICAVVLNQPSTNTTITPQGSDDTYVWHALSSIGRGSITMPGLYIGTNPYRFFRPYFGSFASPGISGYEACGDNQTSVIAPMLNGENGVLNTYQELIAVGHPGCAVFDANGFLIPQGGGLPCAGGGGSTCANPPSPAPSPSPLGCVVLQDVAASPIPQDYNDGTGSAAVAFDLSGGRLVTSLTGEVLSTNASAGLLLCNSPPYPELCGTEAFADFEGAFGNAGALRVSGDFSQDAHGQPFGYAYFNESPTATPPPFSALTGTFTVQNVGLFSVSGGGNLSLTTPNTTAPANCSVGVFSQVFSNTYSYTSDCKNSDGTTCGYFVSGNGTTASAIASCDKASLQLGSASTDPSKSGITVVGPVRQAGGINTLGGVCNMAGSTSCTVTLYSGTFASDATTSCLASVQGTTPVAGSCSISNNIITVTAASANSFDWAAIAIGGMH